MVKVGIHIGPFFRFKQKIDWLRASWQAGLLPPTGGHEQGCGCCWMLAVAKSLDWFPGDADRSQKGAGLSIVFRPVPIALLVFYLVAARHLRDE